MQQGLGARIHGRGSRGCQQGAVVVAVGDDAYLHNSHTPSPSGRGLGRGDQISIYLIFYPLILSFSRREKGRNVHTTVL
jgi:hypothetical protein